MSLILGLLVLNHQVVPNHSNPPTHFLQFSYFIVFLIVSMKLCQFNFIILVTCFDFLIQTVSPVRISIGFPSYNTYADFLFLISFILILMVELSDKIMLLLIIVCGAIGVRVIICAVGSTIGPPHDKLYAVDPVGVHIIIPSAV